MKGNNENIVAGFVNLNKPAGPSSFAMVYKLRKITGIKKIGHAGTLDPFASGVMVLAIGRRATREIDKFVKLDKRYEAEIFLGATTETLDTESEIVEDKHAQEKSHNEVSEVLKSFLGKQEQIPPMFSAKKVGGQKLYNLARKGKEIERKASPIEIYELKILEFDWPKLIVDVKCSSGTYIRTLGADIGKALGTRAYLKNLKRTAIGDINILDSVCLEDLTEENWSDYLFEVKDGG